MFSLTLIQTVILVAVCVFGRDTLTVVVRRARRAHRNASIDPDFEQRQHLLEMRRILERRLRLLQRQAAACGRNTDPAILMEIEDIEKEIQKIDDTVH